MITRDEWNRFRKADRAPDEVRAAVAALDADHCQIAREDAGAFATYVLRDEETGGRIRLAPHHRAWNRLLDAHQRVLLWSFREAGKTASTTVGRVLYELGRNPALRVLVVSNTDAQAQKVCLTIGKYITDSTSLRQVFPGLQRDRAMPWTSHHLFVRRSTRARDASVKTSGVHGNVVGSRVDLLVLDDLLDYENTLSQNRRDDLWSWYLSTLEGTLTRDARVWCVGTAWHRDDFMHRFAKLPGVAARRFPVVDAKGQPTWPERWPLERVREKREKVGPLEFSRQMMCVARSDEDARFKREWVDKCVARGEGFSPIWALAEVPTGFRTFTGVDLAAGKKETSAKTALFTIAVHPDGSRQVLWCDSGRWDADEIVRRIVDAHHRYRSRLIVEAVGTQRHIVEITNKVAAVPVEPYFTSAKTHRSPEFGIESMAVEMANGKWIIPSKDGRLVPELEAWRSEILYYDGRSHPGDRLMASFFAREGANKTKPSVGTFAQNILRR